MEFSLVPWREEFASSLAESADDARIARWLRDVFPHPYTQKDAADFIAFARERNAKGDFYRAVLVCGKAAGSVAVCRGEDVGRRGGELGYWLSPQFWGKGIMSRAVRQIVGEVFSGSDLVRIFAESFADNAASRRVLEKCGFVLEGVLRQSVYKAGVFHDAAVYSLLKKEM